MLANDYRLEIKAEFARRSLRRYVLATHPDFIFEWYHDVLCQALEKFLHDVELGLQPRLMIFAPPRHGKTAIMGERFPCWVFGKHPDWQYIGSSYAATIAEKTSRKARNILQGEFTQQAFKNVRLSKDREAVEEWELTAGGVYKAVGSGGSITGSGAHILGIDDPIKGHEQAYSKLHREKTYEWYRSEAEPRLMPNSGVLLTNTRWHKDDLSGRLIREEGDRWKVINLKAIATEDEEFRKEGEALSAKRFPIERLAKIQERGGWVWNALYQGTPSDEEGGMFKRAWWKFFDKIPDEFDEMFQSWDLSFKDRSDSDFVAGGVWIKKDRFFYLVDIVNERLGFSDTVDRIKGLKSKWPMTGRIIIEDKANGSAVVDYLRGKVDGIIAVNPQGGKAARAAVAQPYVQSGQVYLPQPMKAHWVQSFIEQCADFKEDADNDHDDLVDMMTQALINSSSVGGNFGFLGEA